MSKNHFVTPRDLLVARTLVDAAVVSLAASNHPAATALKALRDSLNRECIGNGHVSCFTLEGSQLAGDSYTGAGRAVDRYLDDVARRKALGVSE